MSDPMKRAVYAGSFDPLTEGHMYMIREGARLFDDLIVAVGTNPLKSYTFSLRDRIEIIRESIRDIPNARVDKFPGKYLVDYARSVDAGYLLRGIRTEEDYIVERTMRNVNSDMSPGICTVFLMPPREYAEVSSSFVKGLVGPEGWEEVVRKYVPDAAYRQLLKKQPKWPDQSAGPESGLD